MSGHILDAGMIVAPIGNSIVFLSKKFELPFTPWEGMGIRVYSDPEGESETYYVEQLTWDSKTGVFYSMTKHIVLHDGDDYPETVEFWKSFGWEEINGLNEMLEEFYDYEKHGPRVVKS